MLFHTEQPHCRYSGIETNVKKYFPNRADVSALAARGLGYTTEIRKRIRKQRFDHELRRFLIYSVLSAGFEVAKISPPTVRDRHM